MFHNEREFADSVVSALREAGFEVRREVPVCSGQRLDVLATKDGVRKGIEIKFTARGLLDDISKGQALLTLPEVDEMYVCAPRVFMSENARTFATKLGVGLLAASDNGDLEWMAASKRLEAAHLNLGGNYSAQAAPGAEVSYNVSVYNSGKKTAVRVEVFLVPAGPFVTPARTTAKASKALLEGGGKWEVTLVCKVKKATRPGRYSLLISARAGNAERKDLVADLEVR